MLLQAICVRPFALGVLAKSMIAPSTRLVTPADKKKLCPKVQLSSITHLWRVIPASDIYHQTSRQFSHSDNEVGVK